MSIKVAVIGANGQLGTDLMKVLDPETTIPLAHSDIEITDSKQVKEVILHYHPDIVINTAAYNRVDDCEENDLQALLVNGIGIKNLALICKEISAVLIHISTDYVFDGEKGTPYYEDDPPSPINAYGVSKLVGEKYIQYVFDKYFIIRTSALYGVAGSREKGGNFVETMIKLGKEREEVKVVGDQVMTPTYTKNLAKTIVGLINTDKFGIYHITDSGECSWYEFAKSIFDLTGMDVKLTKVTSKEFGAPARRPRYSVLRSLYYDKLNLPPMPPWQDSLKDYLQEKGHLSYV